MMTVDEGSELAECLDDMLVTYETAGVLDILDAARVPDFVQGEMMCGKNNPGNCSTCDPIARDVGRWLGEHFAERRREQAARRAVDAALKGPGGERG